MINTPKINEPLPGGANETTFTRQLRTWGKKVVRALIRQNVHGDGRKIAVSKMSEGGVSVHYLEDPPREIGFYAYWRRGAPLGNITDHLIVRAGHVYTPVGTVSIAEQTITPPTAGTGSRCYWVRVSYNLSGSGSVSASWQFGSTFPAFAVDTDGDGNYDQINIPICWIFETSSGAWKIYQRQYGDAVVGLIGDSWAQNVCIDVEYSTTTGKFRKKMVDVRVIRGNMTTYGTTTWADVFTAADCTTTTTT